MKFCSSNDVIFIHIYVLFYPHECYQKKKSVVPQFNGSLITLSNLTLRE